MLMTLTPRISDGRTIVAVGAHGQLSSASGQCRRFQHAVAWSALPSGADACDSEQLFGNVPATDLYRQFVFAWEQTVLPRSSLTRRLTGTRESLGLDRAFQLAEHRPHILDMPAVGRKLQILLERLDRSRGHNVLVAPIQCAVTIKRRSLDEICVCPGRICLDRPVAGSDRAFNQPEIVLGGAEAEISEARIG